MPEILPLDPKGWVWLSVSLDPGWLDSDLRGRHHKWSRSQGFLQDSQIDLSVTLWSGFLGVVSGSHESL